MDQDFVEPRDPGQAAPPDLKEKLKRARRQSQTP
jgi:hypothetical protein